MTDVRKDEWPIPQHGLLSSLEQERCLHSEAYEYGTTNGADVICLRCGHVISSYEWDW